MKDRNKKVRIIVDADGCPGKQIIIQIARAYNLPVLMVADTNHRIEDGYSTVINVDPGRDAADIALVNQIAPGDIVITQDYGVASMSLGKGALAIHPTGFCYDSSNIERLMFERYLGQKARRAGQRTKGPRPRTKENDLALARCLEEICCHQENF